MATTQTENRATTIDTAFEPVKGLNEQLLAIARKAGYVCLDSYEKAADQAIELQLKVGGQIQQEQLKKLVEALADTTREITTSYTSTTCSLLK